MAKQYLKYFYQTSNPSISLSSLPPQSKTFLQRTETHHRPPDKSPLRDDETSRLIENEKDGTVRFVSSYKRMMRKSWNKMFPCGNLRCAYEVRRTGIKMMRLINDGIEGGGRRPWQRSYVPGVLWNVKSVA